MQAAWYDRTGPATEVLSTGEVPDPVVKPGEVLVRVMASGINSADVKLRAGWGGLRLQHPWVIPHSDGAGVIERVGPGVATEKVGARVWLWDAHDGYVERTRAYGTAAELIALPAAQVVPLPEPLSYDQGACLGVPGMTAHRCVFADGPVEGQVILVQGGAGAVGHMAVQMARLGGARVIATVSHAEGAAHAAAAGAEVINRHVGDVRGQVRELTSGKGVDRIIEVDFAANKKMDVDLLAPNGTIAAYSSTSDPFPMLPYYNFSVKGVNLRFIQGYRLPDQARQDAIAFFAVNAGRLDVPIGAAYPLSEIVAAHRRVEEGGIGHTVVRPEPRPMAQATGSGAE